MSKTLNIGLIGSGFMGQAHADAYRRAGILYRNLPCTPVLYAVADQNDTLAEQSRRRLCAAEHVPPAQRLVLLHSEGSGSRHEGRVQIERTRARRDRLLVPMDLP